MFHSVRRRKFSVRSAGELAPPPQVIFLPTVEIERSERDKCEIHRGPEQDKQESELIIPQRRRWRRASKPIMARPGNRKIDSEEASGDDVSQETTEKIAETQHIPLFSGLRVLSTPGPGIEDSSSLQPPTDGQEFFSATKPFHHLIFQIQPLKVNDLEPSSSSSSVTVQSHFIRPELVEAKFELPSSSQCPTPPPSELPTSLISSVEAPSQRVSPWHTDSLIEHLYHPLWLHSHLPQAGVMKNPELVQSKFAARLSAGSNTSTDCGFAALDSDMTVEARNVEEEEVLDNQNLVYPE
ncbi:hypothetical protein GYMLUDRAFT_67159 [Collybiopsis luxurians FD-317 M1]|nr:hypothetical protein GYMLUDRAFT_67159 [Collybiopsis luxurians FD-317 M1]